MSHMHPASRYRLLLGGQLLLESTVLDVDGLEECLTRPDVPLEILDVLEEPCV